MGKKLFFVRVVEALERVVQRNCGCPIPHNVQGQAELDLEQPRLVKEVPAHVIGVELDDTVPFNSNYSTILYLYTGNMTPNTEEFPSQF